MMDEHSRTAEVASSTLLIVEDNPDDLLLIKHHLKKSQGHDFTIFEAPTAKRGLELCREISVDCVLLDHNLPDMDGLSFVKHLQKEKGELTLAVVILTGHGDENIATRAMKLGVQDYLVKTNLTAERLQSSLVHAMDRKRAQNEQKEQLHFLATLLATIPSPIFYKDHNGVLRSCNTAFAAFLGLPEARIIDQREVDVLPAEMHGVLTRRDAQLLSRPGVESYEAVLEDPAGGCHDVVITKATYTRIDGTVEGIVGVIQDITDQKAAERGVKESQSFLRTILREIRAAVLIIDPDTKVITEANAAARAMLGMDREAIAGRRCYELCGLGQEGEGQCVLCPQGGTGVLHSETRLPLPDGRIIPVNMSVIKAAYKGREQLVEILFDITEHKALEQQLMQAQKLEAVGQLAGGIAHELNTPIQYVGDNVHFVKEVFSDLRELLERYQGLAKACLAGERADVLAREVQELEQDIDLEYLMGEIPGALEQTSQGLERMGSIVAAMKSFAQPATEERVLTDVNKAVRDTVEVTRNSWSRVAELDLELDVDLSPIPLFPSDFNQVLLHIITNAVDAVSEKQEGTENVGRIVIRTGCDADQVSVEITDTGVGIPESIRGRIFDPFFTTKEVGKGTGQGLSVVYSLVRKLGGHIECRSEAGEGTSFFVHIPLAQRKNG